MIFSDVVWSRPPVLGQDRSETKKSVLILVFHTVALIGLGLNWSCKSGVVFIETRSYHARRHNDFFSKDTATFQIGYYL